MNPIALDLGVIQIYWYSLCILTGMLLACFLFFKEAKKQKLNDDFMVNLLFYGIIFGIIGARAYYVIFNLGYYLKYPLEIIEVWNGGLAIHGGIIAGSIWVIYYCKKKKVNFLKIFDILAPALIIAQAIGRWGNFFNGEAHGMVTTLEYLKSIFIPNFVIEGMNINGAYYMPTFYFEFIWDLLGFIVIILFRKFYKKKKDGQLAGLYFMWYSFGRFFIEGMRTDSLMLGPLRVAQLISILLFILGLFIFLYKKKDTRVNRVKQKENSENL